MVYPRSLKKKTQEFAAVCRTGLKVVVFFSIFDFVLNYLGHGPWFIQNPSKELKNYATV
jgi:hypothetical protein